MKRSVALACLLILVAALAGAYLSLHRPEHTLNAVAVEPAPPFHALIFRYDTELTSRQQLERLVEQDEQLGLRASAFPLTQDFRLNRNVLFEYSQRAGEVQLHARPMPWGLTDAFSPGGDPTPYQYDYIDRDQVLAAYFQNLLPEIDIFEFNGFYPEGLSLHSTTNRLPWDDDTNYRIIGAAAARAGFRWVSVTSQVFSIGPDPARMDSRRFNAFDREVTSEQPSRWVRVRTGWRSSRSILVVPTSWRDHYRSNSSDPEDIKEMYARMREDIDRHWRVARERGLALVLLLHPVKYVGKPVHDEQFFEFRRTLLEQAKALAVPVMTFSDYASRLTSMQ